MRAPTYYTGFNILAGMQWPENPLSATQFDYKYSGNPKRAISPLAAGGAKDIVASDCDNIYYLGGSYMSGNGLGSTAHGKNGGTSLGRVTFILERAKPVLKSVAGFTDMNSAYADGHVERKSNLKMANWISYSTPRTYGTAYNVYFY